MILTRKALNQQQLIILRMHNATENKSIFSEMDLTQLSQDNAAPFKLHEKANKVIEGYEKYLNTPPTRREVDEMFLPRMVHQSFTQKYILPIHREYVAFRQLIVEKGLITNDEIDQRVKSNEAKQAKNQQEPTTEKPPENQEEPKIEEAIASHDS